MRNALRLTSVCPQARALGLMPGLPLADARARVPDIAVRDADPAADARFLLRLAMIADKWSPMVALDPPDGLLIDISGCAHLFGGEAALAADAEKLLGQFARPRHALASTPVAARALARFADGIEGGITEIAAIRQLPIAALQLAAADEAALRRAGLKSIGSLADRPAAPLAARFGADAVTALARLLGQDDSRIIPLRPLPALHFSQRFAEPIGHGDAVLRALNGLAAKAARALERRGEGGRQFAVRLYRADGALRDLAIETGHPTRNVALLDRLFRERIDSLADPLDPGFGFDVMRFCVVRAEPLAPSQPDLEARPQGGEGFAALVDRLSVRHGRERIRQFQPLDTHVPERAERLLPALDRAGDGVWPSSSAGEPPLRPIVLFDPPQPIDAIAEVPDAPPRSFRWQGVSHIVTRAEGPERIAAPWWRKSGEGRPTRDYYRVEDAEGRRFWLFRQGLYGREDGMPRWHIHGLFA